MKTVDGEIRIEAIVECPECEQDVDLFTLQDLRDDGFIYSQLLNGKRIGTEDLDITLDCPHCNKEFRIKEMRW